MFVLYNFTIDMQVQYDIITVFTLATLHMSKSPNVVKDSVFGEIDSSQTLKRELAELSLSRQIDNKLKIIKKNKAFLNLVDSWQAQILNVAVQLTVLIQDEEIRIGAKQRLHDKIKKFRVEKVPLKVSPRYSL